MSQKMLLYLYGVVPDDAPQPPDSLKGVDGGDVQLVRAEGLCGIVSEVAHDMYDESHLDSRLSDVQWVGARALAHEGVLTWFVDRVPVVPLAVFSLHRDERAVRERLAERATALGEALVRLQGKREWGIRLWRDEERFGQRLEEESPVMRELADEMRTASEGRRFLLAKRWDTARAEEARRRTGEIVRWVFGELRECAEESRSLPIPPLATGAPRLLVLHAAFLVAGADYARFNERVQQLAAEVTPRGFDWEFTGPWPAYHFAADAAGQP